MFRQSLKKKQSLAEHSKNDIDVWYDNIFLVICGSGTSWMMQNVIEKRPMPNSRTSSDVCINHCSGILKNIWI